jgi:hypothetical protein
MILGEVEETITTVEIDEETYEELFKVCNFSKGQSLVYCHGSIGQIFSNQAAASAG